MKKYGIRLWRILSALFVGYRTRLTVLAFVGLASGFLEGISVSLLVPLFSVFVKGGGDSSSNVALNALQSTFNVFHISFSFRTLLIVTLSAFILKTGMLFASGYMRGRIIASYKINMRRRLYEAFLNSSFSYVRTQKTGHLNHVVMGEVKQASRLFDDVVGLILSIGSSIMYLAVAFALSWQITALTAVLGGALLFVLFPLLKKIREYSRTLVGLGKRIAHALAEAIVGIKTVKALGVEREVSVSARALFVEVEQMEFRKYCTKLITKLSFEPVSVIFILIVFAVSYFYLPFNLVSFITIIYLVNRIFGNINNMQSGMAVILEGIPSAEEVLKTLRDTRSHTNPPRGTSPFSFESELAAERVSFRYDASTPVLSEVTFRVHKGESVGIIGPSGAGKTTLVDLLLGLIPPTPGRITLDGKDACDISWAAWRRNIIYVSQEPFLLNATIEENIRFYDSSVSDADIIGACRKANIYELVSSLPKGLKTIVGERGTRLSGGERQRIALARAIARNPEILILDEATSSLDAESERAIKDTLRSLHGALTIIIIAHRLTTVVDTDRIIAIEHGRIVEEGTVSELQANKNSYLSRMLALGTVPV